ncbi:MAG: hypothetical protein LBR46_03945 [Prevotella sp.]|jgi:hypothetical protein|nr:hypothetical protein [Prevotella sp.]
MRGLAEHISIIYQEHSNHNNRITNKALDILNKIREENLADDIILYKPDFSISPQENEHNKRKEGMSIAIKNKATHFLLCDADEFYQPNEFLYAKQYIKDHEISFSACHSYFYIHKPIYRSESFDTTNVCFICKLDENTVFEYDQYFPAENIDPTRRIINKQGNYIFFEKEIVMHHMNFVRENFDSKIQNSSSNSNKELKRFLKKVKKTLLEWEFGKPFIFPSKGIFKIIQVENQFGISAEFKKKKWYSIKTFNTR